MKQELRNIAIGILALTTLLPMRPFTVAAMLDEGQPAARKPKKNHPDTYEDLKRIPAYKEANLLIENIVFPEGTNPQKLARWEEHKKAIHLKALKRSDLDHPDLRRLVNQLNHFNNATPSPVAKTESGFEKVGDLTIFRFTNFDQFINDSTEAKQAAIALGKAMFWDVRFSSDQKIACASCHNNAGADSLENSAVSFPMNFGIHLPWPDPNSPNGEYRPYKLTTEDFFNGVSEVHGTQLPGVFDPPSVGGFKTREVIGSLGVPSRIYAGLDGDEELHEPPELIPESGEEDENSEKFKFFKRIQDLSNQHRQVTQRNAGTVINAVFNSRNFHDSRASEIFNGRTGWGEHDDAFVKENTYVWRYEDGKMVPTKTWERFIPDNNTRKPSKTPNPYFIANASLASQAVEPIVSNVEMSYRGRMHHHIADRMLDKQILCGLKINPNDSSLAPYSTGVRPTYRELIRIVFKPQWWDGANVSMPTVEQQRSTDPKKPGPSTTKKAATPAVSEYDHMEANFSLFWGLSLHVYQSTLISDDSPFDREVRALASANRAVNADTGEVHSHLTPAQHRGWKVFRQSGCADCHAGAEFSSASISEVGLVTTIPEYEEPSDILGEDDDIVAGFPPPKEKTFGVEFIQLGGRLLGLYDGGNYNLGTSRLYRSPEQPSNPLTPRFRLKKDDPIWSLLSEQPPFARYEDEGVGRGFIPRELIKSEAIKQGISKDDIKRKGLELAKWQQDAFYEYISADQERYEEVKKLFGVGQEVPKAAMTESAQDTPESSETSELNLNRAIRRVQPLNNTQQPTSTEPQSSPDVALEALSPTLEAQDPTAPQRLTLPHTLSPEDQQAKANTFNLMEVIVSGQTYWQVTPSTTQTRISLARKALPSWYAQVLKEITDNPADYPNICVKRLEAQLTERIADAGSFRAPTLRNIELTAPYMHNGSFLTLEAVVDFYSRGGDFNSRVKSDGVSLKSGDLHPEMLPLNLTAEQKSDLVEFLKSLTDSRVTVTQAPFDDPLQSILTTE